MAPSSAPLQSLAPDQRAAVELVLRRGLSYGELANLLGLPEETVRARARAGLEALAPDLPPPARAGEVADWLLGQQAPAHAARTQALVSADAAIRGWAEQVAPPLRELSDDVPDLDAELPPPRERGAGRRRPLRDAGVREAGADDAAQDTARRREAAPPPPPVAAPGEAAAAPGRSSRLGGAVLIALAVVVVGGVIAFVLTRHNGNDNAPSAATSPTATATATPTVTGNDIVLRGPAGSQAVGVMQLFKAKDNTVRFLLVAQGLPANKQGQRYSIWFRKSSGATQLLGDVKDPVGKDGKLTAAGPGNADVNQFPSWFATYDNVLVTLDGKGARKPGTVLLSGQLPHGASSR
jgi:Sigma-70, region 4